MRSMVVALLALSMSAQDPDGGASRGRPLAAYRPAVPGIHGLVTAGHPLAAMAGLQVLMKGGNAIDAAVAVGSTLNMMEPQMNGIGGNGFMTIFDKKTGKVYSLSMAGAAPMAIKGENMTPETLDWGINAGIVPGNFGGYVTALQRFGTMSLAEVLASAIDYADHGYPIDVSLATAIARSKNKLAEFPTTAKVFLPGGRAPQPGELFRNPDLAATLRKAVEAEQAALKNKKSRAEAIQAAFDRFYKGDIAQEFDRFFKENHGAMTAADLAAYRPIWAEPLHTTYRGYDVYSNPATSRGGFELEMALNLVEPYDLAKLGAGSPEALHLLIEAIKVSKADIYHYVADPKFTQHSRRRSALENLRGEPAQTDRAGEGDDRIRSGAAAGEQPLCAAQCLQRALAHFPTIMKPSATPPAFRSWINTETQFPARRRSAEDSAPAWSSATPGCC